MKKKLLCLLLTVCFLVAESIVMTSASADIPAGVKDSYAYNTRDDSIILVKKRLEELGYFDKGTQYSNYVSEGLKETVLIFQKKNNVTMDGEIDRDFLELLFSDQAVDINGKSKAGKAVSTAKPSSKKTPDPTQAPSPATETIEEIIPVQTEEDSQKSDVDLPAPEKETGLARTLIIILSVLFLAVFLVVAIIHENKPRLYDIPTEMERIEKLSGPSFEYWCAELLENLGCSRIEATKPMGDYGADLVFYVNGVKTVAQCKHFIKPVGTRSVQEIIGAGNHYRAKRMMILTNRYFTDSAVKMAQESRVVLWDRTALKDGMKSANKMYASRKKKNIQTRPRDPGKEQNDPRPAAGPDVISDRSVPAEKGYRDGYSGQDTFR